MLMPPNPLISHDGVPSAILLIRSGRIATAMLEGELSKLGVTVPYSSILIALLEHGPKSATDLCTLTMRERANMSVLLSKLKKIHYISEKQNPLDARSQVILLTAEGEKIAEQCRQVTSEISTVIDHFVDAHETDVQKFHAMLRDFAGQYHTLYV